MTRINWDELERLGGGAPLDDDEMPEAVQDAASNDFSGAPIAEQLLSAPSLNRVDTNLALQPGETLADRHGHLVLKSMDATDKILSLPIDPDNPRTLSIINSAAQNTMNQQIKIDETRLKARSDDRLSEILARLIQAKERIDAVERIGALDEIEMRRSDDIQELTYVDITAIAQEAGNNDAARVEIAPSTSVPASSNSGYPRPSNYPQIGRHDMPHMRSKR